ncbi:T9SS type A sorting domain-containing protein [Chryseobacterium sp. C39-AII1]|uniref:T9SS type A sorting domain-containing protein n=1 Tax=Chryseobacterium sp. C39-AII1 TaxID=3080332 RepID=UPI00320AC3A1
MKTTLFCILTAFGLCSAQTTITKAFNDPNPGDSPNYFTVNGTVDNSQTGTSATFNNSSVTQGAISSTNYSVPSASEISTFPGSTLKMVGSGNTIYFKQSASKLEITGLVTPDATLNFSANNGTYISYPTNSASTQDSDTASGTFTSSPANGNVTGNFSGTINITVDGTGTLLLGSQTYPNVLKIKSVQNFNLTFSGFPLGTITNTAYFYYDSTHKFPLLSHTTANINVPALNMNQTTTAAQALFENVLGVNDSFVKKDKLKVYPNPATDFIEFRGETGDYSTAKIYSVDGKLIKTSDVKSGKVQVSELPSTTYFIEVSGKDAKAETTKFIKK